MGGPRFNSWLRKKYSLISHQLDKQQLPSIDYLYLDVNVIVSKSVQDNSRVFHSLISPKSTEQICTCIIQHINMIVSNLNPQKMLVLALDGVMPRSKMNNQRARRFKKAKDDQNFRKIYQSFIQTKQTSNNFIDDMIVAGSEFSEELNKKIDCFIKNKIEENNLWKDLSIVFMGSDVPGEGKYKIMNFIRENFINFHKEDNHCWYGEDPDLLLIALILPVKNICIIQEQNTPESSTCSRIQIKQTKFSTTFITILHQYLNLQFQSLQKQKQMKIPYNINKITGDFVFLYLLVRNEFLPRFLAYNIREATFQYLVEAFKKYLIKTNSYLTGNNKLDLPALMQLFKALHMYEQKLLQNTLEEITRAQSLKLRTENQSSRIMKKKLTIEKEFLMEMKTSYLNQSSEGKEKYYEMKFQINASKQIDEYHRIMSYYLHGIEFVYEYYFRGQLSWQWYYPFYYAPLLSDMYFFIASYVQSDYSIQNLPIDEPTELFKQLLCILPKESASLLPESFQQLIKSKQSPLRRNTDFFPDEIQTDAFGSARVDQAISLIPFFDLNLINQVYESALKQAKEPDIYKNRVGKIILYEYNQQVNPLKMHQELESTQQSINIEKFTLKTKFDWKTLNKEVPFDKQILRMPSLKIIDFQVFYKRLESKSVILELKRDSSFLTEYLVGKEVFYGYPLQYSGKIQALLSENQFQQATSFDVSNYELSRYGFTTQLTQQNTKQAFQILKEIIVNKYENSIEWSKMTELYFIKDTQSSVRCRDGKIKTIYENNSMASYSIVPAEFVRRNKKYEKTRENVMFENVKEQFLIGESVLVFAKNRYSKDQKYVSKVAEPVHKGEVIGYQGFNVKVKLTQKINTLNKDILVSFLETKKQIYFTLKFAAQITGLKSSTISTILDTISIITQNPKLPPVIDIGLNLISRRKQKVTTNLVRINFNKLRTLDLKHCSYFKNLEISYRALELILEYKEKFGKVISYVDELHKKMSHKKDHDRKKGELLQQILLSDLFSGVQMEKAIKLLMNVHFWLMSKEQKCMPLLSIDSKQVSSQDIEDLSKIFVEQKIREPLKEQQKAQIITVNPNYLFSSRLANLSLFYLSTYKDKGPQPHQLFDQVICLKPQFFGDYGIIVGIDSNKYEVLFERPCLRKTNLNTLWKQCNRGVFTERQLFNTDSWPMYIAPRQNKNKIKKDDDVGYLNLGREILPKSNGNALNSFEEFEDLCLKNKDFLFAQKFMFQVEKMKEQKIVSQEQEQEQEQRQEELQKKNKTDNIKRPPKTNKPIFPKKITRKKRTKYIEKVEANPKKQEEQKPIQATVEKPKSKPMPQLFAQLFSYKN